MSEIFDWLIPDPTGAQQALAEAIENQPLFFSWFTAISRIVICVLAVFIVVRCAVSLLSGRSESELWGYLELENGVKLPITHWENLIGRSKSSDLVLGYPAVSRAHAVLVRDGATWRLTDLGSTGGTKINGQDIEPQNPAGKKHITPDNSYAVAFGDKLEFAGTKCRLVALSKAEQEKNMNRTPPGIDIHPSLTIYLLTLLQIVLAIQLSFASGGNFVWSIPICFGLLSVLMWVYFLFFRALNRRGFEVDTIAFYLATLGLVVVASSDRAGLPMQFLALVAGVVLFIFLGWFLRDLKRAQLLRWPAAMAAVGLLAFTYLFGDVVYGAKNWIFIGGISIQPSELAKVAFIYAGAATLDRLFANRNLIMYLMLTALCAGLLALMSDFGAVIIFFVAYLVVAYLRSGDLKTIALVSAAAAFGGLIVLQFKPYIAARFGTWLHAWDAPHDGGFQQTRTMSAAASGGLFGMGAGEGWLKRIPAADTDLVFGMVCEELGLIVAASAVACICVLAVFAARSTRTSRSAFYSIAACSATAMLVFQALLNVMGAVDLLPLTGVTFPFVSNGGSSLVSSFGLLAFIKAADTRQNASFAIVPQKKIFKKAERKKA